MDAGAGSNEDDLTVKLQEIANMNAALRLSLQRCASSRMLAENWDFLQVRHCIHCAAGLLGQRAVLSAVCLCVFVCLCLPVQARELASACLCASVATAQCQ